ncbi:hypothetical protein [Gordonia rubripertincta]|nr:hypothetical protein [Gordonia rubripertincta]
MTSLAQVTVVGARQRIRCGGFNTRRTGPPLAGGEGAVGTV